MAREHPESRKGWNSNLIPLREYVVEPEIRLGMFVLLGGAGLVLLIACVNPANLLLARGADRKHEMALRSALGANRSRLVRQMLTESLVLAVAGGIAGLLLARWLVEGLKAAATTDCRCCRRCGSTALRRLPRPRSPGPRPYCSGCCRRWRRRRFVRRTRCARGARPRHGPRTSRLRDALAVAQIALAIVLLVGAGLMLRSFIT